jgi:two-component system NtrC family sensor kinase
MKRVPFVSIKTQFVLMATLLVAISSAFWGWWAWKNERHLLYQNLEGEGRQMVMSLASPIINALLYEEMGVIEEGGLLDSFIEEVMNNTGFPVVHAFVTDPSGKVLTHNNYLEYGKIHHDALTDAAIAEKRFVSSLLADQRTRLRILDMAMPLNIYGKNWGTLRVGVSTAPLEKELHELANRIALASLGFFLFGTLVSYLIGLNLARPLTRLTALMSSVSTDNLALELPSRRPDEIGALQDSFIAMLERLRRSEAEREVAVAQLIQSEKMASIGKIVAGVAHEVNNPLATIGTCIHNLREEAAVPNRNLEIISQGAERIERIVRHLNDFSRAGTLELRPVASDQFFQESAEFAQMALRKHQVNLVSWDNCQPPCSLQIDKGKVQQVILNLLINAADASPDGGTVSLMACAQGDSYLISVGDSGPGIAVELQEKIFDVFYTTKPAGKGTGMGLAICRSIVEMHGGALYLQSEPGATVFTVTIPVTSRRGAA